MSKIHVLREDTISKIAAGEVVERPAAIIKELFENSLDAGSTEITVEIESGGKDLIRVIDNGSGIDRADTDLLFARHATSKIDSIGDLYTLTTMGFRGEALHSIAAVSKVVLITKRPEDEEGTRLEIMGGEIREKSAYSSRNGTMIEVSDLFYNTPVRWKFMKTTTQETRSCIEIMDKLAIANPGISVTFKADGRLIFKTDGRGELLSAVFQVFGRSIAEELMKLDFQNEHIKITGLSSKFSLRKKNRNYILTFVNGRYVKSQELTRTIEGCYRGHLMGGEFPVSFLFIEIDPSEIDVNVHPAKTEIKFADFSAVNTALTSAIKTAIHMHAHVPTAYKKDGYRDESYQREQYRNEYVAEPYREEQSQPSYEMPRTEEAHRFDADLTYAGAPSDNRSVRPSIVRESSVDYVGELGSGNLGWGKLGSGNLGSDGGSVGENVDGVFPIAQAEISETRDMFLEARIIGVYDRTFILMEYRSELYLIDQHAAHEKILFEEYTAAVANSGVSRQYLMLPFEMNIEKGSELPDMEPLGFEVEPFGLGSVIVRAIPSGMTEVFAKDFLRSVFDDSQHESNPFDLATRACKAAIKGGDSVQDFDIDALTKKLFLLDDPFNCPHGRPVIIKFTRREIDRLFKRIL